MMSPLFTQLSSPTISSKFSPKQKEAFQQALNFLRQHSTLFLQDPVPSEEKEKNFLDDISICLEEDILNRRKLLPLSWQLAVHALDLLTSPPPEEKPTSPKKTKAFSSTNEKKKKKTFSKKLASILNLNAEIFSESIDRLFDFYRDDISENNFQWMDDILEGIEQFDFYLKKIVSLYQSRSLWFSFRGSSQECTELYSIDAPFELQLEDPQVTKNISQEERNFYFFAFVQLKLHFSEVEKEKHPNFLPVNLARIGYEPVLSLQISFLLKRGSRGRSALLDLLEQHKENQKIIHYLFQDLEEYYSNEFPSMFFSANEAVTLKVFQDRWCLYQKRSTEEEISDHSERYHSNRFSYMIFPADENLCMDSTLSSDFIDFLSQLVQRLGDSFLKHPDFQKFLDKWNWEQLLSPIFDDQDDKEPRFDIVKGLQIVRTWKFYQQLLELFREQLPPVEKLLVRYFLSLSEGIDPYKQHPIVSSITFMETPNRFFPSYPMTLYPEVHHKSLEDPINIFRLLSIPSYKHSDLSLTSKIFPFYDNSDYLAPKSVPTFIQEFIQDPFDGENNNGCMILPIFNESAWLSLLEETRLQIARSLLHEKANIEILLDELEKIPQEEAPSWLKALNTSILFLQNHFKRGSFLDVINDYPLEIRFTFFQSRCAQKATSSSYSSPKQIETHFEELRQQQDLLLKKEHVSRHPISDKINSYLYRTLYRTLSLLNDHAWLEIFPQKDLKKFTERLLQDAADDDTASLDCLFHSFWRKNNFLQPIFKELRQHPQLADKFNRLEKQYLNDFLPKLHDVEIPRSHFDDYTLEHWNDDHLEAVHQYFKENNILLSQISFRHWKSNFNKNETFFQKWLELYKEILLPLNYPDEIPALIQSPAEFVERLENEVMQELWKEYEDTYLAMQIPLNEGAKNSRAAHFIKTFTPIEVAIHLAQQHDWGFELLLKTLSNEYYINTDYLYEQFQAMDEELQKRLIHSFLDNASPKLLKKRDYFLYIIYRNLLQRPKEEQAYWSDELEKLEDKVPLQDQIEAIIASLKKIHELSRPSDEEFALWTRLENIYHSHYFLEISNLSFDNLSSELFCSYLNKVIEKERIFSQANESQEKRFPILLHYGLLQYLIGFENNLTKCILELFQEIITQSKKKHLRGKNRYHEPLTKMMTTIFSELLGKWSNLWKDEESRKNTPLPLIESFSNENNRIPIKRVSNELSSFYPLSVEERIIAYLILTVLANKKAERLLQTQMKHLPQMGYSEEQQRELKTNIKNFLKKKTAFHSLKPRERMDYVFHLLRLFHYHRHKEQAPKRVIQVLKICTDKLEK